MRKLIFLLVVFSPFFNNAQVATEHYDLFECDGNGDGKAIFSMLYGAHIYIMASQDGPQTDFQVTYHVSEADAVAGINHINNFDWYENITNPQIVTYRVTKISTGEFALNTITLTVEGAPQLPDVVACNSYYLPYAGPGVTYHSGPNGTGQQTWLVTSSQVVYLYHAGCGDQTSFQITIVPFEAEGLPPTEILACESYTLPEIPNIAFYTEPGGPDGWGEELTGIINNEYFFSYGISETGCIIDQLTTISYTDIGLYHVLQSYCSNEGIGSFNLNFALPEWTELPQGASLTYHLTENDAASGVNPLPVIYSNTTPYYQTIYIRYTVSEECYRIYPLDLWVLDAIFVQPPTVIGCDEDQDGTYVIPNLWPTINIARNGNNANVGIYSTLSDAEQGINQMSGSNYVSSEPSLYLVFTDLSFGSTCQEIMEIPVTTSTECGYNFLKVNVRLDSDTGSCENGYLTYGSTVTLTEPSGSTTELVAGTSEYYFFDVDNGESTINVSNIPWPFTITEPSQTVTFNGDDYEKTIDFCISNTETYQDVSVLMAPLQEARPGFSIWYAIIYTNHGTENASGTINLTYDSSRLQPIGTNQSMSIPYFSTPLISRVEYRQFLVLPPPVNQSGDVLDFVLNVVPAQPDANTENNTYNFTHTIVNSYDPNAIFVEQGPYISLEQVSDYLTYTIFFQNTGDATAINVRLEQQLDPKLNPETLTIIGGSFQGHTTIRNGSNMTFIFDRINLQSHLVNEQLSHGFITYKVKPYETTGLGDIISGTASIYFDFNDAITTNTVTTTVSELSADEWSETNYSVFPNPASEKIFIKSPPNLTAAVRINDVYGKEVFRSQTNGELSHFDISFLQSGMFLLTIENEKTKRTFKIVRM